jgi:hypothetical protein
MFEQKCIREYLVLTSVNEVSMLGHPITRKCDLFISSLIARII